MPLHERDLTSRWRRYTISAAIALAYVAACRVMLAPICNFGRLATASYGGDARAFIWVLAWDNHAVLDRVPSLFDANKLYPLPNVTPAAGSCNNWVTSVVSPIRYNQQSFRADWTISQASRLMVRYTHDTWKNNAPNVQSNLWGDDPFPSVDSNWDQPSRSFVASLNQSVGTNGTNSLQFSYSANKIIITRGGTDPGQRYEALKRRANTLQRRVNDSPCPRCPYLAEHRAHRRQVEDTERTLEGGEAELEHAQHRFTREFRALRAVLREAGFLDGDAPTALGLLAEGLYGESALIVANAIAAGTLEGLRPEELAGTLVMLVAEDRGRERPPASRRRFPTARVEQCHRELRSALRRLEAVEAEHGLHTLAPLSLDYVSPAYRWGLGEDLTDIEPPAGADVGDVVKAVKSLYSLLRQMEQALRGHALHQVVQTTRERIERDLIRRV